MGLSTPAKVGILTILALVALGTIIAWKTELFMVREGYEMIGSFNSIEGLTLGSEIRYRGFKIGKVTRIDPGPYDIRVFSVINRSVKFPGDSELRVAYDGIVGLKFLEIRPGTGEATYESPMVLYGVRTASLVDFIDIGSQNLVETKKIMESIRMIVENKQLQESVLRTVFTADKVASDLERLTSEIRETNKGIRDIVTDPKFQQNIKGTIAETEKTLSSANRFFDSAGKMNLRASAGIDIGTSANSVIGNVDLVQNERNFFDLGIGEGPTRQISLLNVLFNAKVSDTVNYRIGVINNQLGGGLAYYPSRTITYRGDIYDINNPKPNAPKVRLGYEHELADYMDLTFKADDVLNQPNRNFTIGIRVKPVGERIY